MAKEIQLSQGQVAIVDDEDFDWLSQWKWSAQWNPRAQGFYAVRRNRRVNGKREGILMHRMILGLRRGDRREGDHEKSGETLNNRRSNLRIATRRNNCCNQRMSRTNTSGFKGVCWHKNNRHWVVQISHKNRTIFVGSFPEAAKIEAARAYDKAARKLHGKFATLNFPEEHVDG